MWLPSSSTRPGAQPSDGRLAAEPGGERRTGLRQQGFPRGGHESVGVAQPHRVLTGSCPGGHRDRNGPRTLRRSVDGAKVLAASRRTWALSVFSQVNSGSERPKWPPLAVLR